MKGIAGKRVIISGGCGDIGFAVARRFVEEGAQVVLGDIATEEKVAAAVQALGPKQAAYFRCDVTDGESVKQFIASAVNVAGGIDVAISNAGMVANAPFLEVNLADFQRTLAVNLTGSLLFAQAAAREMLRNPRTDATARRGAIIFTGSWVQNMPWPQAAAYCASKGGQEMLMKVAAQELAGEGITCNIVAPGLVYAGLTRGIYDRDAEFRQRVDQTVPLARMCSAEELAGSFVFLASEEAAYITGTTIVIDGGASLVRR